MPRSPLTETYKRVQGVALYVKENLSAEEHALFLDMVDPQPEPGPAKKPLWQGDQDGKARHKRLSACNALVVTTNYGHTCGSTFRLKLDVSVRVAAREHA